MMHLNNGVLLEGVGTRQGINSWLTAEVLLRGLTTIFSPFEWTLSISLELQF